MYDVFDMKKLKTIYYGINIGTRQILINIGKLKNKINIIDLSL